MPEQPSAVTVSLEQLNQTLEPIPNESVHNEVDRQRLIGIQDHTDSNDDLNLNLEIEGEVKNNNENQNNINSKEGPVRQPLSDKSPAFKIVANSAFGKYLVLPKTPERKGKRSTERFPFAITSEKYKNMFKEKNEKKRKLEEEKAERKKKRDERKETKKHTEPTNKAKQKKDAPKENEPSSSNIRLHVPQKVKSATRALFDNNLGSQKKRTNSCSVCNQSVYAQHRLVCDECSKIYHKKCIPRQHQMHIPEDVDNDLFLCHLCYQEGNTSDDDIGVPGSDSEDDDELLREFQEYYKKN